MESWEDQGIVLGARRHGENGAVVSLLTESHGRHGGYVRGAQGTRMRGVIEPGSLVDVRWSSRVSDSLGSFDLEQRGNPGAGLMHDKLKLTALQSACALCDAALPEREGHAGLYHGLGTLFDMLDSEIWAQGYVMWEIALLKELGFSLDFTKCAGGADDEDLIYVSPKTGRAVSRSAGAIYKDKLLPLPGFLNPAGAGNDPQGDIADGLKLTAYFLEHWVFVHSTTGIPAPRLLFEERFAKTMEQDLVEA